MTKIDFSVFFPYDLHETLKIFGRVQGWAVLSTNPVSRQGDGIHVYRLGINWEPLLAAGLPRSQVNILQNIIYQLKDRGVSNLALWLRACGIALVSGPKVFVPTTEQFDSMQQVELHLPLSDYRQPYPVMTVAIPEISRQRLAAESGLDLNNAPRAFLVHHDEGGRIFVGARFPLDKCEYSCFLAADLEMKADLDAEGILGLHNQWSLAAADSPDTRFCTKASRSVLNLCLALTHWGHVDGGPLDPEAYIKHRRKKDLAKFAAADFTTVKLEHEIVLRRVIDHPRLPGEPTGIEVSPHWRRGHWRMQPYGEKHLLRKRIFIQPVFVKGGGVVIDPLAGTTTYRGWNEPD